MKKPRPPRKHFKSFYNKSGLRKLFWGRITDLALREQVPLDDLLGFRNSFVCRHSLGNIQVGLLTYNQVPK